MRGRLALLGALVGLATFAPRVALAACASPIGTVGDIVYNSDFNTVQFCEGTNWISMSGTVASESDPQVGAVANNQWCRGDGTAIQCDQAAPSAGAGSRRDENA